MWREAMALYHGNDFQAQLAAIRGSHAAGRKSSQGVDGSAGAAAAPAAVTPLTTSLQSSQAGSREGSVMDPMESATARSLDTGEDDASAPETPGRGSGTPGAHHVAVPELDSPPTPAKGEEPPSPATPGPSFKSVNKGTDQSYDPERETVEAYMERLRQLTAALAFQGFPRRMGFLTAKKDERLFSFKPG